MLLSDETCCQKQITGNIVKMAIFNMGSLKNVQKWKKWEFPYILTITVEKKLHINVIVENYNEISL